MAKDKAAVTEPEVRVIDASAPQAVKVDFEAVRLAFEAPKPPPRKKYWVGTLANCPHQNVYLEGVCFPRYVEKVSVDPDSRQTDRVKSLGQVYELTDEKVAAIIEKAKKSAVRFSGEDTAGHRLGKIYDHGNPGFRVSEGDMPLACYVYMVRIGDLMPNGWRDAYPEPMMTPPAT
jgi:hypothetical protein